MIIADPLRASDYRVIFSKQAVKFLTGMLIFDDIIKSHFTNLGFEGDRFLMFIGLLSILSAISEAIAMMPSVFKLYYCFYFLVGHRF